MSRLRSPPFMAPDVIPYMECLIPHRARSTEHKMEDSESFEYTHTKYTVIQIQS